MAPRRCRAASASPAVANLTMTLRRSAADAADSLVSSPSATRLPLRSVTSARPVAGATVGLSGTSRSGCRIGAWPWEAGRPVSDGLAPIAGVATADTAISARSAGQRRIGNLLDARSVGNDYWNMNGVFSVIVMIPQIFIRILVNKYITKAMVNLSGNGCTIDFHEPQEGCGGGLGPVSARAACGEFFDEPARRVLTGCRQQL